MKIILWLAALVAILSGSWFFVPLFLLALAHQSLQSAIQSAIKELREYMVKRHRQMDEHWERRVVALEKIVLEVSPPQEEKPEPSPPPIEAPKPIPSPTLDPDAIQLEGTSRPAITPPPLPMRRSASAPKVAKPSFSWSDLETSLGGNWLNKIGVGTLVIGVSLLIGYSFQYLGPLGKITIGYIVASVLLGGGVALERRSSFRLYGGGLIGGGWALGYFTTYAVHNIDAVRVVESEWIGLTMLGAFVAGMIAHSLKYQSQIVTGLAYLLGFVTVTISDVNLYSLSATFLLAASLVAVCIRLGWFHLALAGAVATYGCHLAWLYPRLEAAKASGQLFDQLWPSVLLLVLYWLLFLLPNYLTLPQRNVDEQALQITNLVSAAGFLSLMSYQAHDAEWFFLFLLALGTAYISLAGLSHQTRRRNSYLIFATLGAGLFIASVPTKLTGDWIALTWLLESQVLLFAGFFLKERYFRGLSWVSFTLVLCKLLFWDINTTAHFSLGSLAVYNKTLTYTFTALCFYFNNHSLYKRFHQIVYGAEFPIARIFSYSASILVLLAIYFQSHPSALALSWCVFAVLLLELGRIRRIFDLRVQGFALATLSLFWLITHNFGLEAQLSIFSQRLWTVSAFAGLFYYLNRQLGRAYQQKLIHNEENSIRRAILYIGTALLAVLIWYEMPTLAVGVAWGFSAVVLVELGRRWSNLDLRVQGYATGILAFGRLFLANLTTEQTWNDVISLRLLSVAVIVVYFYYLFFVLRRERSADALLAQERRTPELFSFLAVISIAALCRFEFATPWVAIAWCTLAIFYLLIGTVGASEHFRSQGYGLVIATLVRAVATNLTLPTAALGAGQKIVSMAIVIALLFVCHGVLLWGLRQKKYELAVGEGVFPWLERKGLDLCFYSAAGLLVILTFQESPGNLLTILWGLEGLFLFGAGLIISHQSFRLFGLALLLVCVSKIFFYDLRGLDTLARISSFIILGLILLLVSFLYTRFGSAIKRYL